MGMIDDRSLIVRTYRAGAGFTTFPATQAKRPSTRPEMDPTIGPNNTISSLGDPGMDVIMPASCGWLAMY
jgi:hypothetical protein